MNTMYPHLLAPITVGNTIFRNRFFTAPISLHSIQAGEPFPTEAAITHFANKAKGGAACVTCVGVSLFPYVLDSEHAVWDVYQKSNVNYLAQLADRIHFYGAKASMELGVSGVVGGEYGASEGIILMAGNRAKEMPESEMERIANGYAYAAGALKSAGFDMVLLHFGHGLLVGQFLSPLTNRRTHKYGGSMENRARFPNMIIDRIRKQVGRDLLIEVRISGAEFVPGGIVIEEAIEFTKLIEDKIDFIHVSAGIHDPKHMTVVHPCGFRPSMPNVPLAEAMKRSGVKILVITIGGIQELSGAEKVLAEGKADIVSIARGLIADPHLIEKAYANRGDDVRPCIKCMRCHDSAVYGYNFSCSVNPEIGLEHKLPLLVKPPETKKKIIIIGGGPAGMEAALISAGRGHEVILIEKSDSLGGLLKFSERVSFKYDLMRFKNYLVNQVPKAGVQIRLNTKATPETIAKENADVVIVAVGAEPIVPPIPGIEGDNVVMALNSYGMEDQLADEVVIIGGGEVGCETALHLGKMGKKATVVEMQTELAPDASTTHRGELLYELEKCENVYCLTSARCTSITKNGIVYSSGSGKEQTIKAGSVIISVGMKSNKQEAESFRESAGSFYIIGDCAKVATVENAIKNAYYTTIHI
jgi:2,4-dienoyl-CoA reductase-like NADH-dependent reductase (Old Yellow Enzyme family)/thioredoxin reductase